jgi:histidyl-tRNA synthetase
MSRPPVFQAPKGMRDYYPAEMLRRRYIERLWRDVSIRHGFEEIEGPIFEHAELYTVKSGEAILGEIFGVFSGKDEEQVAGAAAGRAPFALRPEFTPTLARMFAARAGELARPTKWFMGGPLFRAERPQRGRLREFLQWNADFIGGEDSPHSKAAADAEVLGCMVGLLEACGLSSRDVRVQVSSRSAIQQLMMARCGVPAEAVPAALMLLDRRAKMNDAAFRETARPLGFDVDAFDQLTRDPLTAGADDPAFTAVWELIQSSYLKEWCDADFSIARGLAYYTGMVFEVHEASGAERALAGGGRYDKLIELFGGPPTPAVGFGMGDVVLSLVLQDRGLMPEGAALLDQLGRRPASLRPDVFVLSNATAEAEAQVRPLVAQLRRGDAGAAPDARSAVGPLHARQSYRATRNIGKLLKEASDVHARFAAIIESGSEATLKDLVAGTQERVALSSIAGRVSGS